MKTNITERLSKVFQTFAENECKGVSDLYYQLAKDISREEGILSLSAHSRDRQPIPNLLLGAIHFLLLQDSDEELCDYYPSISKKKSERIPIDLVRDFCTRRESEIIKILSQRIVQTNAINRTAYLMPIISSQFREDERFNLVDIGTSSGLTLNYDLYAYTYENVLREGESQVKIKSEIRGGTLPQFKSIKSPIRKIGIDQHPLDVRDAQNALWLKALIWPDVTHRFELMEAAINIAKKSNVTFYKASSSQRFKEIIEDLPEEESLFIYHTHVLYQFTPEERILFRKTIDEIGKHRETKYLAVEAKSVFDYSYDHGKGTMMELTVYRQGEKEVEVIGETDGHANWVSWRKG